jgi:AcrR family transcriptional regulator
MASQDQRSEATKAALIAAGAALFGERGYAGVSVGELAGRAKVTTGALYHQFRNKEGLFRAVYADLVQGVAAQMLETHEDGSTMSLISACEAYLDAVADPAFHRITLVDGPAVLGWDEVRGGAQIVVAASLEAARDRGEIADQPIAPLARMLVGALKEAGMAIAVDPDPAKARAEAGDVARLLVAGISGGVTRPSS